MDNNIFKSFESVGNNCEFGFLLASHSIEEGGLFKWAFVQDFHKLAAAISDRMKGSLAFEELRPFSQTMFVDSKTDIAFHTRMKIQNLQFSESEEDRRFILREEVQKFNYLREKFFKSLANDKKIYVVKCNTGIANSAIDDLLIALRSYGDATLLHVRRADDENPAGTVIQNSEVLFTGFIDRFADYAQANDISKSCWDELCARVWNLKNPHAMVQIESIEYEKNDAPISVPEGFTAENYYLFNPGVKEAGMDAAEHYLNHGWKEGRAWH